MVVAVPIVLVIMALTVGAIPAVSAAVIQDPVGDFDNADVVAVETTISGGRAAITIRYASEQIGMATGAGGFVSIDSDLDANTGEAGTPGFDCRITFNVSQLAPMAELEVMAGRGAGNTATISPDAGNGTNLEFGDRWVRFTLPLALMNARGDFRYAVFATGMFSAGDEWDRVPDSGTALASTGQVVSGAPPGLAAVQAREYTAEPAPGVVPYIRRATTRIEGSNAVWRFEMSEDLPVGALDFQGSSVVTLYIDADRNLATGIDTADIPFLPFGPDRSVQCTLVPGGASLMVTVGIRDNGERETVGGGAGTNDLRATFDRRSLTVTVPLDVARIPGAGFSWMACTTRLNHKPEFLLHQPVVFDTGERIAPLPLPGHVVTLDDPVDAKIAEAKPDGAEKTYTVRHSRIPNTELRRVEGALTPAHLFLRITYAWPIAYQQEYITGITIQTAQGRQFLLSVNWDAQVGGQAVLREMTPGADMIRAAFLNQCLAAQGNTANLLLPAGLLGLGPGGSLTLLIETHQMGRLKPGSEPTSAPGILVKTAPRQEGAYLDRLPDQGVLFLRAL